jgi:hypothetical protein
LDQNIWVMLLDEQVTLKRELVMPRPRNNHLNTNGYMLRRLRYVKETIYD